MKNCSSGWYMRTLKGFYVSPWIKVDDKPPPKEGEDDYYKVSCPDGSEKEYRFFK